MKSFVFKIIKSYGKDKVSVHASSATFYIMVSAVPLIAILFFSISLLPFDLSLELEEFLSGLLPKGLNSGFEKIMSTIKENKFYSLVPFTVITALWGSTKGVGGLCRGVECIFDKRQKSGFISNALKAIWRSLLFYLVVIASLLIFSLGKLIYKANKVSFILGVLVDLRIILFVLFLALFFAIFYARLNDDGIKNHIVGAAFSSATWTLFTYFYSLYISYSLNNVSIYAGMSAVILFMLWVYFGVNIILIGAEINKLIIN